METASFHYIGMIQYYILCQICFVLFANITHNVNNSEALLIDVARFTFSLNIIVYVKRHFSRSSIIITVFLSLILTITNTTYQSFKWTNSSECLFTFTLLFTSFYSIREEVLLWMIKVHLFYGCMSSGPLYQCS